MAEGGPRAGRDVAADLGWVALSAAGGPLFLIIKPGMRGTGLLPGPHALAFAIDAGLGAAASAALWFRRRWPAGIAVAMLGPFVVSLAAGAAVLLAVLNVSIRRRAGVALAIAGLYLMAFPGYYLLWYSRYPLWVAWLWAVTEFAAVVAWGMYIRARRQLLASLREQVAHAEAAQKLLAEQARHAERTRIAQEMHDVLGHRISLMALHAGALEVRPDLPPARVAEAAGLIRATARQALEELRAAIGVLRDGARDGEAPLTPQPSLGDITRLVQESRQAGLDVALDMQVETPEEAPGALGRDACRIVREALTNASKHAPGTKVAMSVAGRPGQGPAGHSPQPAARRADPRAVLARHRDGTVRPGRTGRRRRRHPVLRPGPSRGLRLERGAAMAGMTGTISQPGTSRGRPLRVLLVDDDPLVRAGLRTILSSASDLDVVSEAADGSAAITAVRAHCVDVALMDVRMPGMDGITATKQITALPDPPKVIVLTTFHLDEYVFGALRAGASGFLLKDTPPADIVGAVRLVAAGDAMLSHHRSPAR